MHCHGGENVHIIVVVAIIIKGTKEKEDKEWFNLFFSGKKKFFFCIDFSLKHLPFLPFLLLLSFFVFHLLLKTRLKLTSRLPVIIIIIIF